MPPGIFDEDVEPEESSTSEYDEDSPGSRGDEAGGEPSGSEGHDQVAELTRKLEDERGVNEELTARLTRLEGMIAGMSGGGAQRGEEKDGKQHTIESLAEHATGGGKEAFEAAVAYIRQEEGNFRERILNELRQNQSQEATRSELERILPGISDRRSRTYKAVESESARILARSPSIAPERAWDLAVVEVARTAGAAPGNGGGPAGNPANHSRDRRVATSAAAGAARGGDREPGAAPATEFTREDEAMLKRMNRNSRVFSSDPKVRANARKAFLKIKANLAERSQPSPYQRPQFGGR